MSGTRIFVYSLFWSLGNVVYGIATHKSSLVIFSSAWDLTCFALSVALIARIEGARP